MGTGLVTNNRRSVKGYNRDVEKILATWMQACNVWYGFEVTINKF